jgi:hypothetical protein
MIRIFCKLNSHIRVLLKSEKYINGRINIGKNTNTIYIKKRIECLNILNAYISTAFSFQLSEINFDNKTLFADTIILIKYLMQ